jgi:hypothetical protein
VRHAPPPHARSFCPIKPGSYVTVLTRYLSVGIISHWGLVPTRPMPSMRRQFRRHHSLERNLKGDMRARSAADYCNFRKSGRVRPQPFPTFRPAPVQGTVSILRHSHTFGVYVKEVIPTIEKGFLPMLCCMRTIDDETNLHRFITETHMVSNAPIRMWRVVTRIVTTTFLCWMAVEVSQLPYQCHHGIAEVWR